jgi:hypothetical protein
LISSTAIRTHLPCTDDATRPVPPSVGYQKVIVIDTTEGPIPRLAIIVPAIQALDDLILEYLDGVGKINAVLANVRPPLRLVPFEFVHNGVALTAIKTCMVMIV